MRLKLLFICFLSVIICGISPTYGQSNTTTAPLFIMIGESNIAGQYGLNTELTSSELAIRPRLQIINNSTLKFEPLKIGTNNLIDHFGIADNTAHGWENALARSFENNVWGAKTGYLIKSGQGGSTIAQWANGGTYWNKFMDRLNGARAYFNANRITPTPFILFTLGINDRIATTPTATYKAGVKDLFSRLREQVGMAPILIPYFMQTANSDQFDFMLNQICEEMPMVYRVSQTGATQYNTYHWDSHGLDTIGNRMVVLMRTYGKEGYDYIQSQIRSITQPLPSYPGIYSMLEDKTFTNSTTWTLAKNNGNNDASITGGKLHLLCITTLNTYAVAFKTNIFVPGDIVKVTVYGVNVISGNAILGLNDGNYGSNIQLTLANGTNVFYVRTLTGSSNIYTIFSAPPPTGGEYTVDRVTVERQNP